MYKCMLFNIMIIFQLTASCLTWNRLKPPGIKITTNLSLFFVDLPWKYLIQCHPNDLIRSLIMPTQPYIWSSKPYLPWSGPAGAKMGQKRERAEGTYWQKTWCPRSPQCCCWRRWRWASSLGSLTLHLSHLPVSSCWAAAAFEPLNAQWHL